MLHSKISGKIYLVFKNYDSKKVTEKLFSVVDTKNDHPVYVYLFGRNTSILLKSTNLF